MAKKFFTWLLLFIGITLVFQSFQPDQTQEGGPTDDFVLQSSESSYALGEPVVVLVTNNLEQRVQVSSRCPSSPLSVTRYDNGTWKAQHSEQGKHLLCNGQVDDELHQFLRQPEYLAFPPKETTEVDLSPWKDDLFPQYGRYRVALDLTVDGQDKVFSTEVLIEERGFFSSFAYHLFYRPMFNILLFLTSILPGYRFGLAVIALTIIIRLILLVPNQKALKSQKAMMKIQPELEAIKKKYKGDQEKISKETMALWQKHKVNPVGGCLPMLLQLPILIALFYVVKGGFSPFQGYIVYDFLQSVDVARVSSDFFGILDVEQINATWLPIFVGGLQFFQMKLSFARRKTQQQKKSEVVDVDDKGNVKPPQDKAPQNPLNMMNKTMLYFMPVMIALMVASLPAAVGLYLTVSALFGIGQQMVINRQ